MNIKLLLIIFGINVFSQFIYSQNLVTNPSFEEFTKCPDHWDDIKYVLGWEKSAEFSCDYYNSCGLDCVYVYKPFNASKNFAGNQKPKSGYGYAGYIAYSEFLTSKLLEKLQFGKEYYVEAFVSFSDRSEEATKNFGFLFTDVEIVPSNINQYKLKAQIIIPDYIEDKRNWVKINGSFKALGTEEYITIGNFIKKKKYKKIQSKEKSKGFFHPYYYIDDVKVTCLNCKQELLDSLILKVDSNNHSKVITSNKKNYDKNNLEIDKSSDYYTIKNLFFATDSSTILSQSYAELSKIVYYLKKHTETKIEIQGHTDITGNEERNLKLSKNRAKSVSEYFINNGIEKNRIIYNGYGSSKPIDDNNTKEGRSKNRRVVVKFL